MAISDKTRKFLWAKSGNTCAVCKTELITDGGHSSEFNIGEECHIISSRPNGPRHKLGLSDYDVYENLVLLCRNHHKQIDELIYTYTEELLRYIRTNHENWVRETMKSAVDNHNEKEKPRFLSQVTSGKILLNIVSEAYGFATDYDEVDDEQEMEYIGNVLTLIIEYGDNSELLDISGKISAAFTLQKELDKLNERGYMLFADRGMEPMFPENPKSEKWEVATLFLRKKENPEIIKVDLIENA